VVDEQGDVESELAPDKISAVLQKMTTGGASAIFMGWASFPSSEFDVVARTGTPTIHSNAYSGNTEYVAADLEKYGNVFMSRPTEFSYARGFASYLQELEASGQFTPKNKTIGVVTATDGYSLNIAAAFKESMEGAGYTQILYEKFTPPLSEWGPILAKVRANPADVVFFSDYITGDAATFTKQFRTDPTPSLLFINLSPSSPEFYDLVGEDANGVFWSSVSATLPDASGQDFLKRLEDKTGQKPGLSAPGSQYDGVRMWALAASLAGDPDDYEAVVKNLRTLKYRGVNGTINFKPEDQAALAYPDQVTDPTLGMPTLVYQAQNQQNVVVSPAWLAAGEYETPSWVK
jgi:branched-chain amino acid transport system substrate-binding protein